MKKILAAVLMVPCVASAQFWTGNDIYNRLNSEEGFQRIHAMGYISGAFDVASYIWFCPPAGGGITVGQVSDIAKNWLANNPHRRNESAEKLLREAYGQVWPCPKRSNKGA